jgi:transcription elongation factor Elf1
LKGIERSVGFETRLFECAHCGAVKAVRIEMSDTVSSCGQAGRAIDRTSW